MQGSWQRERRLVGSKVLVVYFYSNTYSGFTAVTFQFSLIGKDPGGAKLLQDLDQDPDIGEYIDALPIEFDPEPQLEDKWSVVCYNRLFSKLMN